MTAAIAAPLAASTFAVPPLAPAAVAPKATTAALAPSRLRAPVLAAFAALDAATHAHASTTRRLLSAGAAAGLLPFADPSPATGSRDLPRAGIGVGAIAATWAGATAALHVARRPAMVHRGAGTPKLPSGPPGNAGAGGIAGGPGGVSSGVWCALLFGCVLFLATTLRRHRIRLALPAPCGVVLLLDRPG